ncbi:Spy/CpxP family protein refolding chaperone [Variovorax sp. YR216]|uniref:Spy/CpxP family protein refolding chaperone n=1 Tax=Variovorax sp. YR216 TaxID=1882828 RepID=UPI00089C8AE3|nr:Spy/CpxP family protein refolding chaperone [Variovorax sp. YR216]SEA21395.1 LTXXQ motif family protein [Variovorax sp. YR216]
MTRFVPRLAAALLSITLAGSGFAQFAGGMGGGMGGRRGSGGASPSTPRSDTLNNPTSLSSAASSRLYDLRLRLRITPEQSPLWDAFQTKAWDLMVHNAVRAPGDGDASAAQTVRARAERIQTSSRQWTALADAVDRLYEALSPEQRQVADQELPAVLPGGGEGSEASGAPGKPEPPSGGTGFR